MGTLILLSSLVVAKGAKNTALFVAGKPSCQKKVMGFVTKDFNKLTSHKLKDNFICNKLPEMDESCCRKEDYEAIEKRWNSCQANEYQTSYVNSMKLLMKFREKLQTLAVTAQKSINVKVNSPGTKDVPAPKKPVAKKTSAKKSTSSKSQFKSTKSAGTKKKSRRLVRNATERILQSAVTKKAATTPKNTKNAIIKKAGTPAKPTKKTTETAPVKVEPKLNAAGKVEVNATMAESINRIVTGEYKPANWKNWKIHASRCYDRLDILMKGYMCSFCSAEVNLRWSNKSHVKISDKDAGKWARHCGEYIKEDYKLIGYARDAQNVLKSLPGKNKAWPKPEHPLPKEAEWKKIVAAIDSCNKDALNCGKAMSALSRVMAISQLTRIDLEWFHVVRDIAVRILNFDASKVIPTPDAKISTPAVKVSKKMRRLIAAITKKEQEPFNAMCQIPYKHTVKVDGKSKTTTTYSPDYKVSVDSK